MTKLAGTRMGKWLAVVGIIAFGILNFVNQGMPLWFNTLFIVGCLVALVLLPKAKDGSASGHAENPESKGDNSR